MAKARQLDKRRKSIKNIRKITRTMELIATARFKRAMDRAVAATAYTQRITRIVADLAQAGLQVSHGLLEGRETTGRATLLALTANRGLCGGYNSNVVRAAVARYHELRPQVEQLEVEVSGKRGVAALKFRQIPITRTFTHFDDQPKFEEVEEIADRYLEAYVTGQLDRLDVAYMRFVSMSKQEPVVETLLPLGSLADQEQAVSEEMSEAAARQVGAGAAAGTTTYEFLPSAESILEEIVPASFKVKLFKCFLDAAVSEQVARMVAMKSATDNADQMIRSLSRTYNRARQSQITSEIMDIVGGVEALSG